MPRVGGGELIIYSKTLIAGNSLFGASPYESSIAVIPKDQMSALISYPSDYSITSGAIQHGDPTNVYRFYPALTCADTPKSLRKILPSLSIKTFPALISLCIYPI